MNGLFSPASGVASSVVDTRIAAALAAAVIPLSTGVSGKLPLANGGPFAYMLRTAMTFGATARTPTAATNASPIVVTTSVAHGYSTGETVTLASFGGNTAANGTWTITKVTNTQFSLNGSTGNGAYTSGGTVTPNPATLTTVQDSTATWTISLAASTRYKMTVLLRPDSTKNPIQVQLAAGGGISLISSSADYLDIDVVPPAWNPIPIGTPYSPTGTSPLLIVASFSVNVAGTISIQFGSQDDSQAAGLLIGSSMEIIKCDN